MQVSRFFPLKDLKQIWAKFTLILKISMTLVQAHIFLLVEKKRVVSNTVGCCMQKFMISGVFGKETFKLSVCPIWLFFLWLTSLLSTSSRTHCISWLALALLYFFRCKEMWVRDAYGIVQLVWRKQKHTLWRRPIINQSSTAILLWTFVTSWFVTNDSSFLLGLLCYDWWLFCNHESSLHKVFTCITSRFVTNGNSFVF